MSKYPAVWTSLLLPLALSAQATFTVAPASPSVLEIDTRHGSGNIFEFTVTNNAPVLDYVTIQRSLVRSNGQEVFGVPSPEYGVSIAAGGSTRMWFRWDLIGQVSPGSYSATVPFKSELNGQMVNATIGFVVRAAVLGPQATVSASVVTESGTPIAGASLNLTDLSTAISNFSGSSASNGGFSFSVPAGDYALTVDAAGYRNRTEFFSVTEAQAATVTFPLTPSEPQLSGRGTGSVLNVANSIWTMRASADASVAATAPMGSQLPSAFHGIRGGQAAWSVAFPGITGNRGTVSQFQAVDCDAAVSADGKYAAGMDYSGKLYLIDAATGAVKWSTDRGEDRNPLYPPNSPLGAGFFTCGAVAFSPDGARIAAGGSNGWLVAFETASGAVRWSQAYSAEIRALRFTEDGQRLAVGAGDWKFRMLDASTGTLQWAADNQFWPLFFVALDQSGTLVGSGSKESEFRLWDAATGALKWMKKYPAGAFVSAAAIHPARNKVYVSDWTQGVRAYDLSGKEVWFRRVQNASMAVTADGRYVFVAGYAASGPKAVVLYVLDEEGTVLWEERPDTARNCQARAPFASDFFKSTAIARVGNLLRAVTACVGGSVFTFEIPLAVVPPVITGVTNAATFGERLSPGAFASVFGENLSSGTIRVGSSAVPAYFTSEKQINFLLPLSLPVGSASIAVETAGGVSASRTVLLEPLAPGIFFDTVSGYGAILISGTALTTNVRAGRPGEFLEIYCTGLGGVTGSAPPFATAAQPVVTIGGISAAVQSSSLTAIPGLYQVNVQIPAGLAPGEKSLVLTVGGVASNAVKVAVAGP